MTYNGKSIHLITTLWSGGAQRMLYNIVEQKEPCDTIIIYLRKGGLYINKLNDLGVKTIQLNLTNIWSIVHLLNSRNSRVFLWMYHPMVIGFLLGFRNRKNMIFNIRHSLDDINREKSTTRVAIYVSAFFSRFIHRTINNSEISLKQHENIGFHNQLFIPNGFKKIFDASLKRERYFLIAARNHKMKKITEVIKLFEKYPSLELVIVGRDTEFLETKSKNIIILGEVEPEVVQSLIRKARCLLCTSAWGEGFPNVVGEAMAAETPIISTKIGAITEEFKAFGLQLIEINDFKTLEELIQKVSFPKTTLPAHLNLKEVSRLYDKI